MLEELQKYKLKLQSNVQNQQDALVKLEEQTLNQLKVQLTKRVSEHWQQYKLTRRSLDQEEKSLHYYISLARASQPSEEANLEEHEKEEKRSEEYRQALEKVNLYSLFKLIEDKISYNEALMGDFSFACALPDNKPTLLLQQEAKKAGVLEQKVKELEQFVMRSPHYEKLSKREAKEFQQIRAKYENILKNIGQKTINLKEKLEVKDSFGLVVSCLNTCSYLRQINISIVNCPGIMQLEDYQKLIEGIYRSRFFAQTIKIKIMDMEFCQEKCDLLKRFLKKMKVLHTLIIHNYYAECKMGNFEDYNWHPFRKKINIKSGVWK